MSELTYEPAEDGAERRVSEEAATYQAGGAMSADHNALTPTRIAARNGGQLAPVRTTEQARELARRRWDRVSAAARAGIVDAGKKVPGLAHKAPDVIRYAISQHTLNSFDPSAHGSQQSLKLVLDLAYPKPEREVASSAGVPDGGATLQLSPDLARELLAAMRAKREGGE